MTFSFLGARATGDVPERREPVLSARVFERSPGGRLVAAAAAAVARGGLLRVLRRQGLAGLHPQREPLQLDEGRHESHPRQRRRLYVPVSVLLFLLLLLLLLLTRYFSLFFCFAFSPGLGSRVYGERLLTWKTTFVCLLDTPNSLPEEKRFDVMTLVGLSFFLFLYLERVGGGVGGRALPYSNYFILFAVVVERLNSFAHFHQKNSQFFQIFFLFYFFCFDWP